jgi:hypothetical protein
MADFTRMNGTKLPLSISAVVGSAMDLKLIPGPGQKVPIAISVTPPSAAKIDNVNVRAGANFTTFRLTALMAGSVRMVAATDPMRPITITIDPKLALPAATTDQGLLARLLIAETPSPEMPGYTDADAETSMIWMRVVIANRLSKPSGVYASANAKTIADVIKAPGQFKGFQSYPTIDATISKRLDETVSIANESGDGRREKYKKFVQIALKVAAMASVKDPSTGLYFWRTSGSGAPSTGTNVYKTILGNTFYTL